MEYLEAKLLKRFNVELNREHKVIYDIRNVMRDGLSNSKQGTFSLFFADREDHCEKQSIASIDCNGNGQLTGMAKLKRGSRFRSTGSQWS